MSRSTERWLAIAGFDGHYEVSDMGRVRSMSRVVNRSDGRSMRLPSRILNLKSHRDGYVYTTLSRDGQASSFLVHRLVAAAFMECPTGRIRHVSGDRSDNRLVNLLDADTISPVERLWERTTVDESTGCWVFAGGVCCTIR